ncbi:hypothetical protein GQ54DRAFT_296354 [Martensiomyces pterosporus]|nr:hypothetical protein GQ54DRAFT_296354 [Martensiomyces pterosporus]
MHCTQHGFSEASVCPGGWIPGRMAGGAPAATWARPQERRLGAADSGWQRQKAQLCAKRRCTGLLSVRHQGPEKTPVCTTASSVHGGAANSAGAKVSTGNRQATARNCWLASLQCVFARANLISNEAGHRNTQPLQRAQHANSPFARARFHFPAAGTGERPCAGVRV